eukprot:m.131212 g.131212  ORF g.131212 m.131212 type:complete len:184 (+) comp13914_c0_seq8:740-1291(+)
MIFPYPQTVDWAVFSPQNLRDSYSRPCAITLINVGLLLVSGKPGRVVTLVEEPEGRTWGIAYRIPQHLIPTIMPQLDHREKGGYTALMKEVHLKLGVSHSPVEALVYIGTEDNEDWAGPGPLDEVAKQMAEAVGPSGPNPEYLFNLAEAMRHICPEEPDPHLYELEAKVKALVQKETDVHPSE